jgi:hypothetical protein
MRRQTQPQALKRLTRETRQSVRALEDQGREFLLAVWDATKHDLETLIIREYRQDFPKGNWTAAGAAHRDTLGRIQRAAGERLDHFRSQVREFFPGAMRELAEHEAHRQLWMLDVLTPPSLRVKPPMLKPREALAPQDYSAGWYEALDNWVQAFQETLGANLRLEALHEGGAMDAADEVGSTLIGGFDPSDKFKALFTNQALLAQQAARDGVADSNEELVAEEIWRTMEDTGVCPICDPRDGVSLSEIGDEIPAHFNCRCFSQLVPRDWATLLRSGDPDDREVARMMDDADMVPNAMAVRGPNGELTAHFTIDFNKWTQGRGADLGSMNIVGVP